MSGSRDEKKKDQRESAGGSITRLVEIMGRLRSPEGCPWDREQAHHTLTPYIIEEAYEVIDAIDSGDDKDLCEELGDLLLQVVFHAQIARERGAFDLDDVVKGICEKLIRRHPHVFSEITVEDAREVIVNWERIKREERKSGGDEGKGKRGRFDGLPKNLPGLLKTYRIFEKMERMESLPDGNEAAKEFERLAAEGLSPEKAGRLLFLLARYAQRAGVEPEEALRRENEAFIREHNHS